MFCCVCCVVLFAILEGRVSVVCSFDNASRASGKFGGVAGVLAGVIT